MSRCTLRNIFTVLIYAGVAIFLFPYLTGHFSNALLYLVAGIGLAVLCGIFLVLVSTILIDSARPWIGILRGTQPAKSTETPFVLSQLRAEEI